VIKQQRSSGVFVLEKKKEQSGTPVKGLDAFQKQPELAQSGEFQANVFHGIEMANQQTDTVTDGDEQVSLNRAPRKGMTEVDMNKKI
jgi:hypothetical protein